MSLPDPSAFDAFAGTYDAAFTRSPLGQRLRRRVWQVLAANFAAGAHVLELACGTGEDAIWLAQRGVRVAASDGSAAMLRVAAAKAKAASVEHCITFHHLSLQALDGGAFARHSFDGILSNFGGLNTIGRWHALAAELARLLRPGGRAVLVPMGPVCPWEIGWHLLHGEIGVAMRRLRGVASARIGDAQIPIWYPSARRLQADFAPWFRPIQTESLGLWLPPTYLGHLLARWPTLFRRLGRLEEATAHLGCGWGDHYISVLERLP